MLSGEKEVGDFKRREEVDGRWYFAVFSMLSRGEK